MDLSKLKFAKGPAHPGGLWGYIKWQLRRRLGFETHCGAPRRCTRCLSTRMKDREIAVDGGYVSESETRCLNCNKLLGYWAYGYWEIH